MDDKKTIDRDAFHEFCIAERDQFVLDNQKRNLPAKADLLQALKTQKDHN